MSLYKHLLALKEAGSTICLHDVKYIGADHTIETRHIVEGFDEDWIYLKNILGGEGSFQFINMRAIASCCITDYSRRKIPRD